MEYEKILVNECLIESATASLCLSIVSKTQCVCVCELQTVFPNMRSSCLLRNNTFKYTLARCVIPAIDVPCSIIESLMTERK